MSDEHSPATWRAYTFLFLAQASVGVNIVASKYLLKHISPFALLWIRFLIAAFLLCVIYACLPKKPEDKMLAVVSRLSRRDMFFLFAQGLSAGTLFNILLYLGLHYTSASVAGIITSALPALICVLSFIFLRERLTWSTGLSIVTAVLGLVVINVHNLAVSNQGGLLGDAIILIALLPEAGYYIMVKFHVVSMRPILYAALMNLVNLPFLLIIGPYVPNAFPTHMTTPVALLLLTVGGASAVFYVFWALGSRTVTGSVAGLFTAIMPVSTIVIAWIFLGESISALQMIGMGLVVLSILLSTIRRRQPNYALHTE